jgi:ParB family chromosome partitioning protein
MTKKNVTAIKPQRKPMPVGLGLESADLSRFLNEDAVGSHGSPKPMELDLSLIDEDPDQPRTIFNEELLSDMAKTIRARGVKNPISVHTHPQEKGRYVINDGARRYRASKLAGRKTIKAFVDSDFSKIDQVIVNAHAETFTPREWAVLIDHERKAGKNKSQIAEEFGKSNAFVTQHLALLQLPDPIADAFNSGTCVDLTAINELLIAWKRDSRAVEDWLGEQTGEVTRSAVKKLREFLDKNRNGAGEQETESYDEIPEESKTQPARDSNPTKLRKTLIQVRHKGRTAQLILNRRPSATGMAWLRYEDDGVEFESQLDQVQLVALVEG